ncbi:hypothetical protein [Streptomyces sp. CRN 30]|uniref:hypothetical protein n=1 Tax=Streptomyces sp. CRN 30 TaxID=3075613 RepID=UPI002A820967|nr:hypothetical protein [Streptomyces sp. CRN 30]
MSTPVHHAPERQSSVVTTVARQRREQGLDGSSSATSTERALLQMQASAGNRAATVAVQRVRGTALATIPEEREETSRPGTPDSFHTAWSGSTQSFETAQGGESVREDESVRDEGSVRDGEEEEEIRAVTDSRATDELLKRATELLDRIKKDLDPVDNMSKGAQAPTSAGLGQAATASGDTALKHDAAISGTSGASWNLLTELTGAVVNGLDTLRNLRASRKKTSGAGHHTARKKVKVKGGDTAVGVASTGGYGASVAKDGVKLAGAADTVTAAEVSGIFGAVTGLWKGARAAMRVGSAARKHHRIKSLGEAGATHGEMLTRLAGEADAAWQQVDERHAELQAVVEANRGRRPGLWYQTALAVTDRLDAAYAAAARARATHQRAEQDVEMLGTVQGYAKKKQLFRGGKEVLNAVGEPAKAAGGIVVAVTAAGALGSNPAGWITAAVGAGLIAVGAGYKGARAGYKRFQEAHHPERYTPEGEEDVAPKSVGESLKHSLKVWKKVSRGERQLMAHRIYNLASGAGTTPEVQVSARELLVALKAGPEQHKLDPTAWAATLVDPDRKADWIKEITEQLASG